MTPERKEGQGPAGGRMTVTTETAKVYKLRGEANSFAWAIITIRRWKGGGQIDVQSDYGSYAYLWASIGDQDFRDFLCKVGFDYFMGKAHHKRGYQVDWDATAENLKRLVLESRREGMDPEKARACFDALEAIDKDEGFFWNAREYDALGSFLSRHEHPTKEIRCPDAEGFWTRIWPHACAFWKAEMDAEAPHALPSSEGSPHHPNPRGKAMSENWRKAYWRPKGNACWTESEILEIGQDLVKIRERWTDFNPDVRSADEIEIKWAPTDKKEKEHHG